MKESRMQYLGGISKTTAWSLFISKANHSIAQQSKSIPQTNNAEEAKVEWFYEPTRRSRTNTKKKKKILFIIGDWNAKVGSQELPAVTGKFVLRLQKEAGQKLIEFCQENALS